MGGSTNLTQSPSTLNMAQNSPKKIGFDCAVISTVYREKVNITDELNQIDDSRCRSTPID